METSLAKMTNVNKTQRSGCRWARFLSEKVGKRRITRLGGYASLSGAGELATGLVTLARLKGTSSSDSISDC